VVVEVVPAKPRRRRGFPFDLFDLPDPLGGRPFPGFDEPDAQEAEPPTYPPLYTADRAPDPNGFLLTKASPLRVVIGEAVRVDIIAYGGLGNYLASESSEPSREGFLAYRVPDNAPAYLVPIDGKNFVAKRVHALVLFPVRTGSLKIGSSSFEFRGGEYSSRRAAGLKRESQPVTVIVTEPPVTSRPPGYRVGDVGRYELSASVEPRTITEGAAVSVIAKLEGTGNLPSSLQPPGQKGVEWLEPTTTEHLDVTEGKVQGFRTFTYVVKLDRPGEIDLGELTLPFYDPAKRGYSVARATLGKVTVKPDPNAHAGKAAAAEPTDALKGLLPARDDFGNAAVPRSYIADRSGFWAALALGPLAVLVLGGAARAGRKLLEQRRALKERPSERAIKELDRARDARTKDAALAAGSSERAVLLAIEGATGLKARGVLRSDLAAELRQRGVSEGLAAEIVALFDRCEDVRFSGPSLEVTSLTVETAERVVHAFTRGKWKA
jgi:hypothetical protein